MDASSDLFRMTESGRCRLPKGKERLFRVHDVSVMEARGNFLETFSPGAAGFLAFQRSQQHPQAD